MNQPLVSVIVPTYNHASFIGEAIDSILSQTYRNFELIIIDNYSDDETLQIVSSFDDPRVNYYKFSNKGIIAASRNFGIQQAKGKYVAFIDSDDIWLKDKLKLQVDVLEEDKDVGLIFCLFKVQGAGIDGKILGPKDKRIRGYVYERLLNSNFIVSSSVMIRMTVFDDLGTFDEAAELCCVEDFDLWLRIARNKKVFFIPTVEGIYRIHSLNKNSEKDRLQKALRVIDKHLSNGWTTVKKSNQAKANFYFREGWFLIDSDVKLARSYFKKAIKLDFGNLRILLVSLAGLIFSALPFVYRFVKVRQLDKRINYKILNPQNL